MPSLDLERVNSARGYTPLLSACNATYDPYGYKVNGIRLLIEHGAGARACCKTFGNSALHLALLSARDEVSWDGKTWKGDNLKLRQVLTLLMRAGADIDVRNNAGLSPSDLAVGLRCVESWNNGLEDCGFFEHVIGPSHSDKLSGQDFYSSISSTSYGMITTTLAVRSANLIHATPRKAVRGGAARMSNVLGGMITCGSGCPVGNGISNSPNGTSYEFEERSQLLLVPSI